VPIGISVDVGLLHELSPELIMNNEDNTFNLGFGLNFSKKNFLGDARKLTIGVSAAAQNIGTFIREFSLSDTTVFGYTDARLSLEQPYIFGNPINTKLETYLTLQKLRTEYNSRIFGTKLNFDFELPQNTYLTSISTYINWEDSRFVFTDNYLRLFIPDSLLNILKANVPDYNVSKVENTVLGLDMGANRTNNLLFPTRGYNLSLLLEHGNGFPYLISKISGSEFNRPIYYKAVATIRGFLPIDFSERNVFGSKLKLGVIRSYAGDMNDIPINQRFYAGGSNSIRGWGTRDLVPQDGNLLPDNPTGQELEQIFRQGILPGGFFILEGSFEMRNRLLEEFGSALFIDYGNTWNDIQQLTWNEIAIAAGFGFRYYSEFVPIRLDFGFKVYDPWDTRSMFKKSLFAEVMEFHLGIGEAF
jgi:outer membrane protein insertion porin family